MERGDIPLKVEASFAAMKSSTISDWVGAGDSARVGRDNAALVALHADLPPGAKVLDFGCGIGRTTVGLLERYSDIYVVGTDIVPKLIEFCNHYVRPSFSNTEFHLFNVFNDHYKNYEEGVPKSTTTAAASRIEDSFFLKNAGQFHAFLAFSVFTHLDENDAKKYLSIAAQSISDDGFVLMTAFLIDGNSAAHLALGHAPYSIAPRSNIEVDRFFHGFPQDRLAFVGMPFQWLERFIRLKGLYIERVLYGSWRAGQRPQMGTESMQDLIVMRKSSTLPTDFSATRYLELNEDVKRSGMDGAWHYLRYGRNEGRKY